MQPAESQTGLKVAVTCSQSRDGGPYARAHPRPDAAADADAHADVAVIRVGTALGAGVLATTHCSL